MIVMEKKFRAFHDGGMVYDAARVGNVLYWDGGRWFDRFAFRQKVPAVLLQAIDYRDVTATDIYEGDILRDDDNRLLLVEWWQGGFTFVALTDANFARARRISEWFEIGVSEPPKIIGNIFENPELLGGDA